MWKKIGVFFVCIFFINLGISQSAFSLKYFGLTIHPFGDATADIQPYKLDKNARFVANFGGFGGFEKFIYKDYLSVKLIEGLFTDCSGGWAMVHHLGIRFKMMERDKHSLYFGIGPTFLMRNSWTRFGEEYNASGYFRVRNTKTLGTIQTKFIPYGLELEYDYKLSDSNRLSFSFTPGIPLACILSVGWKRLINPKEYSKYKFYIPPTSM